MNKAEIKSAAMTLLCKNNEAFKFIWYETYCNTVLTLKSSGPVCCFHQPLTCQDLATVTSLSWQKKPRGMVQLDCTLRLYFTSKS